MDAMQINRTAFGFSWGICLNAVGYFSLRLSFVFIDFTYLIHKYFQIVTSGLRGHKCSDSPLLDGDGHS